jgi:hypothetical protein
MRPAPPAGSPLDDSASAELAEPSPIVESFEAPASPGPVELASPEVPQATPTGQSGPDSPSQPGGWRPSRGIIGLVLLTLLGIAIASLVTPREEPLPVAHPSPAPTPPEPIPTSVPPPSPQEFSFGSPTIEVTRLVRRPGDRDAAEAAAGHVTSVLARLYDVAFLHEDAWIHGPPDEIWDAFLPTLQKRARSDVEPFSLGTAGPRLEKLDVSEATLTARVLLDAAGHPQAILAEVVFEANGRLFDGSGLDLENRATYLLRPSGGSWLIAGYPRIDTTVKAIPSPSSAPSTSRTPSSGPSSTGSP